MIVERIIRLFKSNTSEFKAEATRLMPSRSSNPQVQAEWGIIWVRSTAFLRAVSLLVHHFGAVG